MVTVPIKKRWVRLSDWRGYEEYYNSVADGSFLMGDTPHNIFEKNRIKRVKSVLKKNKIPHRVVTGKTSNVMSIVYDVVVRKKDKKRANEKLKEVI